MCFILSGFSFVVVSQSSLALKSHVRPTRTRLPPVTHKRVARSGYSDFRRAGCSCPKSRHSRSGLRCHSWSHAFNRCASSLCSVLVTLSISVALLMALPGAGSRCSPAPFGGSTSDCRLPADGPKAPPPPLHSGFSRLTALQLLACKSMRKRQQGSGLSRKPKTKPGPGLASFMTLAGHGPGPAASRAWKLDGPVLCTFQLLRGEVSPTWKEPRERSFRSRRDLGRTSHSAMLTEEQLELQGPQLIIRSLSRVEAPSLDIPLARLTFH